MTKLTEYEAENFDIRNIPLIKKLAKFFLKKIRGINIRIYNEMNGFYEDINEEKLIKELTELSKKYTGIDEIILEKNKIEYMYILFHEGLCLFEIDISLKKELENEFGLYLKRYIKK